MKKHFFTIAFFLYAGLLSAQKYQDIKTLDTLRLSFREYMQQEERIQKHVFVDIDTAYYVYSAHRSCGFTINDKMWSEVESKPVTTATEKKYNANDKYQVDTFCNCFASLEILDINAKKALREISYFKTKWLQDIGGAITDDCRYLSIATYDRTRSEVFIFNVDLNTLDRVFFSQIRLCEGFPKILCNYSVLLDRNTKTRLKKFQKKISASVLKELSENYLSKINFSKLANAYVVCEFFDNGCYTPFIFSNRDKIVLQKEYKKVKIHNLLDDIYYPILDVFGYNW